MGCLTGFIAKIILTAFNIAVSITGVAVITLSALTQTYTTNYGSGALPDKANDVLIGLETVASMIIILGAFGMLVSCCCQNKLFLYTYMGLGAALVIAMLTFGIMGQSNLEEYKADSQAWMEQDMANYVLNNYSAPGNKERDDIYHENQCCGVTKGPMDWMTPTNMNGRLPLGCCIAYPDVKECEYYTDSLQGNVYQTGCFTQLLNDVEEISQATMAMGIFFALLLAGLVFTTCFCIKCTDAMPI